MIIQGDVREILRLMPDEMVNCVITSPPYWGLRDYGLEPVIWDAVEGCEHVWGNTHTHKTDLQAGNPEFQRQWREQASGESESSFCTLCGAWRGSLGLEPTFQQYISHLMQIFDEVKRVLKKDGTCWVNLGDSYSGSWGDSGYRPERTGVSGHQREKNTEFFKREGHPRFNPPTRKTSVKNKSLCQIPSRFAIAMTDAGWILRNEIIWHKRNCMPSSVKDRFTVDFEKVFFFVKDKKYWFEQQFEEQNTKLQRRFAKESPKDYGYPAHRKPSMSYRYDNRVPNEQGRNKRCVWKDESFDIGEFTYHLSQRLKELAPDILEMIADEFGLKKCVWDVTTKPFKGAHFAVFPPALVEPILNAGCPPGGTVLDPFAGSGTVGVVAKQQGKDFIGIDLNPAYCDMAEKRIG